MNVLFLDDDLSRVVEFERRTQLKVYHVTSVAQLDAAIRNQTFDLIMLDHDLALSGDDGDGTQAAQLLAKFPRPGKIHPYQKIVIHSTNPYGVAVMVDELKHHDYVVFVIPRAWARCARTEGKGIRFAI